MRQRFTYRPTLFFPEWRVVLDDGWLELNEGRWRIDLRAVTRVAYVANRLPWGRFVRFDLTYARRSYRFTLGDIRSRTTAREQGFLNMVRAVLAALADLQPDLNVTLDEYGSPRLGLFLAPLIMWSLPAGAFALAMFRSDQTALLFLGLVASWLCYRGIDLAWGYAPWLPLRRMPVRVLAAVF
jgi:hypothetical protein